MSYSLIRLKFPLFVLALAGMLALSLTPGSPLAGQNWGLLSFQIILIALVFLYRGFEKKKVTTRDIAVIAVLGTVAAVGRIPFAALPGIQPVTFLVIISGYVFGVRAGFMVGSTAALVSNFFLGQGPWTPWQMFAWGLAGSSAALFSAALSRAGGWGMGFFLVGWGYFYGWIINLWFWSAFISPLNLQTFLAVYAASFWMDTLHALGNLVFYLFCGEGALIVLKRVKNKLEVSCLPVRVIGKQH